MSFNNLRIAQKLLLGFGAIVLVIVVSSGVPLQPGQVAFRGRSHINDLSDEAEDQIDRSRADFALELAGVRKFLITGLDADKANVSTASADHSNDLARVKTILGSAAPEILPDLDTYQAQ